MMEGGEGERETGCVMLYDGKKGSVTMEGDETEREKLRESESESVYV